MSKLYESLLRALKEVAQIESRRDIMLDIEHLLNENINKTSDHGMSGLINSLIISEYDAIDQYNSAMATAEAEGVIEVLPVLKDIIAEEHTHVGQLQALAKLYDTTAEEVTVGVEEAELQLRDEE